LIDVLGPPELVAKKNNTEYYIDLINGSRIKLGGTDNLDFVGQGGSGYALSEYSLHKDAVTSFLTPILDEGNAFVIANGTMRGKENPLYKLWENNRSRDGWFVEWLTLEDTKTNYWINEEEGLCINPELVGLISPENGKPYKNIQEYVDSGIISFAMAKQEFLNRAESDVAGSYYGHEMTALRESGRVHPIDPMSDLVYTFWDTGGPNDDNDKTTILFAHVDLLGKKYRVIDYYENTGLLRGHYCEYIANKGYNYGGHYLPHDTKRSDAWTGEDSAETARRVHDLDARFVPKAYKVINDIEICRRGLANTEFDSERCNLIIQHVENYHESTTTGKACHKNTCQECRGASHGADAFRCMQMAIHLGLVTPYLDEGTIYEDFEIDDDWMLI